MLLIFTMMTQALPGSSLPEARPLPLPPALLPELAQPQIIEKSDAPFPEAARMAGHHGQVKVTATVDANGRVNATTVTESSRSDLLDAAAADAARSTRFRPALDDEGKPTEGSYVLTYKFDDRTLKTYRCADAVRDVDWWHAVWPGRSDEVDWLIYWFAMLDTSNPTAGGERDRLIAKVWTRCRATPDALLADAANIPPTQRGSVLQ